MENSFSSTSGTKAAVWLVFLTVFLVAIFRSFAYGGKIPFFMDPVTAFYPYSHYHAASVSSGFLPLWNPYIFSGYPFIGDTQAAVMYPLNLILSLVVVPEQVLGVKIVLHFILAGVFTFLFLLRLKCVNPAAFLGAVAFALSGALIPKIALPPIHQTASLIPLCFFAFSFLCERPIFKRAVLCGLPVGLLLLSGYMQVAHFAVITLLLYLVLQTGVVRIEHRKVARRKVLAGNVMCWLGGLFLVLAPIISLTGGWTLIIGPVRVSMHNTTNPVSFGTFLAVFGWVIKDGRIKASVKKFLRCIIMWAVALFVGACVAAPQLLPSLEFANLSHQELHRIIPRVSGSEILTLLKDLFFASSSCFEQQSSVGTLPILLFVATVIMRKLKCSTLPGFVSMSAVLVFSLLAISEDPLIMRLLSFVPGFLLFHFLVRNVSLVAFPAAALGAISANYMFSGIKNSVSRTAAYAAVIILTALQLLHYSRPAFRSVSPEEYMRSTENISFLKNHSQQWRAFGFDKNYSYEDDREEGISRLLVPNTAMLFGVRDAQGYGPLQLKRYNEYLDVMSDGRTDFYPYDKTYHMALIGPHHSPLLDVLGVKYALSEHPVNFAGFSLVKDGDVKVYENPSAFPVASIFTQFVVLPDSIETTRLIHEEKVNPAEIVILSEDSFPELTEIAGLVAFPEEKIYGAPVMGFNKNGRRLTGRGEASVKIFDPNYLQIACNVPEGGGILFMNEIFYPGWRVKLNGDPVTLIRANYLFRAVIVPEGEHVVEMEFIPRFYRWGLGVSALLVFVIISIFLHSAIKLRRGA